MSNTDLFISKLVNGGQPPEDCALLILWYLDSTDGIRLSLTCKNINQWIHNKKEGSKTERIVQWWRDLAYYNLFEIERSLLVKICRATELDKWRIIDDEIFSRGDHNFESVVDFWINEFFLREDIGEYIGRWSFKDCDIDDELLETLENKAGFPDDVLEQIQASESDQKKKKQKRECTRCGNSSSSTRIYYCVCDRSYCSNCMDEDNLLALRFLLQCSDDHQITTEFEEANCVPDFDLPPMELKETEFSMKIGDPYWLVSYDGRLYFIGDGPRDPDVDYSEGPPENIFWSNCLNKSCYTPNGLLELNGDGKADKDDTHRLV